jgi:hypothetical protein
LSACDEYLRSSLHDAQHSRLQIQIAGARSFFQCVELCILELMPPGLIGRIGNHGNRLRLGALPVVLEVCRCRGRGRLELGAEHAGCEAAEDQPTPNDSQG